MVCSLYARLLSAVVPFVVLSAFAATPVAAAEIVKCVAKDGTPLYQNFPCNIDSLGSLPSNPPVAKTAAQEKSKNEPVKLTSPVKAVSATEPGIGMAANEVRAIWGEPKEVVEDELRSGRVAVWRYADGRLVQFDNKRRVVDVQR